MTSFTSFGCWSLLGKCQYKYPFAIKRPSGNNKILFYTISNEDRQKWITKIREIQHPKQNTLTSFACKFCNYGLEYDKFSRKLIEYKDHTETCFVVFFWIFVNLMKICYNYNQTHSFCKKSKENIYKIYDNVKKSYMHCVICDKIRCPCCSASCCRN